MKRFHIHLSVPELAPSIAFYSRLFGQAPSREEADYAKWMLDDPRINFAISSRGHASGLNHLGFQADEAAELDQLRQHANAAGHGAVLEQGETTCCYANSQKHWTIDPQGIAWEHFRTLSDAAIFGTDTMSMGPDGEASPCCEPLRSSADDKAAGAACCVPTPVADSSARPATRAKSGCCA